MENFVTINKEKVTGENIPLIHNDAFTTKLGSHIMNGDMICIHGPSGCGKSCTTREILKEYSFVDFHIDFLKSKKETVDMLSRVGGTGAVLLFDDVYPGLSGWNCVVEFFNNCKVTTGPVIFVTREFGKIKEDFEDIICIETPVPSDIELLYYAKKFYKISDETFIKYWKGNLRNFINSVSCLSQFGLQTHFQDEFFSTTESIHDLICKGGRGHRRFIGNGIEEHGHTMDLIFSNYKCDTIEDCARVAESLSRAEVVDNIIYAGNWDFLPYFTLDACIVPSKIVGNTIDKKDLVKGTSWTKHYNMKMRGKQLEQFKRRTNSVGLDIDSMTYLCHMLRDYPNDKCIEILTSCNIISSDLDLMNHIVFDNKLKGKKFVYLKKQLKQYRPSYISTQNGSKGK